MSLIKLISFTSPRQGQNCLCVLLYTQQRLEQDLMPALFLTPKSCPRHSSNLVCLYCTSQRQSISEGGQRATSNYPLKRSICFVSYEFCIHALCWMTVHSGLPVASLLHAGQGATPSINNFPQ